MFPHHSDQMSQSHLEAISFPRSSFACSVSRFHFSLVDAPVCMFINCSCLYVYQLLVYKYKYVYPLLAVISPWPASAIWTWWRSPSWCDAHSPTATWGCSWTSNLPHHINSCMKYCDKTGSPNGVPPGDRSRNDQCPDNVHSITWKSYWSTMYFHGDILLLQPGHVHLWLSWSLRRIVHSITRNCSYCS